MITLAEMDKRLAELTASRDRLQQVIVNTQANLSAHLGAIEELARWRHLLAAAQEPERIYQPGE